MATSIGNLQTPQTTTRTSTRCAITALAAVLALAVSVATAGDGFCKVSSHKGKYFPPRRHCSVIGAGHVLPPQARPFGYSLDEMASAVANFSISGNDPAFYPDTPFQIVYNRPDNTYTVKPGTFLYLKFFFIDDSEPVIGDWPANQCAAANYIFGADQLGGHDLEVEIDGQVSSLDHPGYIGGPVPTPDSPDGSEHLIQIGAFVSPLPKGTHTVTIRGVFDGAAILDFVGGPLAAEITYTVVVQ